jgi:hypothetical protein
LLISLFKYSHSAFENTPTVQMPVYGNWSAPHGFSAANGTAEAAAAGRYTGKISLMGLQTRLPNGTYCPRRSKNDPPCTPYPEWNNADAGTTGTVAQFSAVCWYTGKALFEKLGASVPVGLIVGSVGGSPIEFWLPPGAVNNSKACGADVPPCDNRNFEDSDFFVQFIEPLMPYTIGSMVRQHVPIVRGLHSYIVLFAGVGPGRA